MSPASSIRLGSSPESSLGVLADRPAASGTTRLYFATDDNGGTLYVSNGTSWLPASQSGVELAYAEITANATSTTSYPTRTDVAGLSISPVVGARPIKLRTWSPLAQHSVSGGRVLVSIMEGATELAYGITDAPGANKGSALSAQKRAAPSAGAHTYKVSLSLSGAGTASYNAGAAAPAFLEAVTR